MPFFHALLAVLVAVLWGGNYVASRIGMEAFPPLFYTGIRFALVAALMLPFAPLPSRRQSKQLAGIALVLCVGHMGLILIAIHQGLNIAASAIVVQMGVPFSCLLSAFLLKDRLGLWRTLGLVIAFIGMVIITGTPNIEEHPVAFVVAVVSAFFWAVSNIQIKKMGSIPTAQFLAWKSLFAVPMLMLVSYLYEGPQWESFGAASLASWAGLFYTALFSSIIAYGLWSWLIGRYEVSKVAPYSLLVPPAGILSGQLFFREELTAELLIGGAIVLLGVAIITLRRPKLAQMEKGI